ncbi:MAG: prepilin-type N-terminal cleavage/methylation domain-containing protein [Verrucomicrobiota bacterium]
MASPSCISKTTNGPGFTLVELSIVLVIIGLIIGGVLVGRDLITAATVRAQIAQIEKYQTAVNTFRGKYGYLPGDIPDPAVTQFGLAARAGSVGSGDGNGLIEAGAAGGNQEAGENRLFWNDLSTTQLINGQFVGQDCVQEVGTCVAESTPTGISSIIPAATIGRGNYITIVPEANGNGYAIMGGVTGLGIYGDIDAASGNYLGITPQEAYSMDAKIDDGNPTTGRVLSIYAPWPVTGPPPAGLAGTASLGECGDTDTAPTSYNRGSLYANLIVCMISIRFQ